MQKVNLPDGRTLKIPNDLSAEKRDQLANAVKAEYNIDINQGSLGEWLIDKPVSTVRGLSQMIPTAAKGLAGLALGSDSDIVKGISDYQRYIATESPLASDPKYRDTFGTKLAEGAGSLIGFGGAAFAGRKLAAQGIVSDKVGRFGVPGALAVPMGMGEQVDRLEESRALGETPGRVAEKVAILTGGVIGMSELAPIERLFRSIPKSALKNPSVQELISTRLKSAAATGTAEAFQEAGAGIAQNLTARGLYSDEIPIFDSALEEFTIGGILGASADLFVNSLANRRSISSQQLKDAEERARDNRTNLESEDKFAKAQEQGIVEEFQQPIIKDKPEIPVPAIVDVLPPDLGVIENPDGQFAVVDYTNLENPVISTHADEVTALRAKNKEQTNYERKKLQVEVDNDTYIMGMPDSSSAKTLGRTILDPNLTQINLSTLIGFDSTLSEDLKKELNKEKTAAYAANTVSEMLENKVDKLQKTSKYLEGKGLELKSSFSMPDIKKVLKPKDYNALLESFANHAFTESEKAGEPSIREDKDKVDVSVKNIKAIAEAKNIELDFKDPAVRYAAKQWTGFEDIPKTRNRGAKELFLARIHSLPAFNTKNKFPDFRPRAYTGLDMANFTASAQDIEFTKGDLLSAGPEGIRNNKEAVDQFVNDLVGSGRARKVEGKNKYEITDDFEYTVARRQEGFNETPDEFRARLERDRSLGKNKLSDEAITNLVTSEEIRQEKVLPPKELEPKLFNFAETIQEGRTNKFAKELQKKLQAVGLGDTGIVVSNDILSTTTLAKTDAGDIIFDPRVTRPTAKEGAVEGEYDRNTDIIFLSLNAVNPDGTRTDEQILQNLDRVLDHEMIHAFREKDLISEKEYQYLRAEVKRKKVPTEYDSSSKNETFYTRAKRINSGTANDAISRGASKERVEELYIEEAIAEMFRAREFKPVTPKTQSILDKIIEFFKSMGQAMRISGYKDSSEIFADIESGKIGARERGQVRTLRELDRISMAREQGIVGGLGITPTTVPEEPEKTSLVSQEPSNVSDLPEGVLITPVTTFEDVEADTDPITGVVLPLGARQRGGLYDEDSLTREELLADAEEIKAQFNGNEDASSIEILDWLTKNGPSEDYRVIAQRLSTQLKKIKRIKKINFYTRIIARKKGRWTRLERHKGDDVGYLGVSYGLPFQHEGELRQQVYIRDGNPGVDADGVTYNTLLHELVHQTTQAAYYSSQDQTTAKAFAELEKIRQKLENERRKSGNTDYYTKYGLKNVQELLAVGLTDRKFQKFMEEIKFAPNSKKTLWDKFTENLRKILQIPAKVDSAFSEFLLNAGKVTNLSTKEIKGITVDGTSGRDIADYSRQSLQQELNNLRTELYNAESIESADSRYVSAEVGNRNAQRVQDIRDRIAQVEQQLKQPVAPEQLPLFSRQSLESDEPSNIGPFPELPLGYKSNDNTLTIQFLKQFGYRDSFLEKGMGAAYPLERDNKNLTYIEQDDKVIAYFDQTGTGKVSQKTFKNPSYYDLLLYEQVPDVFDDKDIPLFSRGRRFTGEANTQEKIELQKATELVEEFTKKTPRGEIPVYNLNASDVALKAAYDYINDPGAPTINELPNYSRVEREIPEELQGVVNRGGYVKPRAPWYDRLIDSVADPKTNIKKFFKDTRQNYIDKLDKVEKKLLQGSEEFEEVRLLNNIADTSAIAALRMADKARGIFQGLLTKGFATDTVDGVDSLTNVQDLEIDTVHNPYIDGDKGTGGLLQITAPLFSDPLVDLEGIFGTYAKLKRVQQFQKDNRKVESPFTQQDLEFINNIEANYPVVVEVYNNFQKWNNKLVDFAEAKGLLNSEQANEWREKSTYYPFYRDMVEEEGITAPRIGGGSLPNNPLNIKLKGSEAEIDVNPLEAIARNSLSILTASMKNDGALKLVQSLEAMGEAELLAPKQTQGANTIFVFEDGFKKYYDIVDPELFHGIRALGGAEVGFITKILAMPSTILRDTVTRDPGFIAVNLLRDTLSATVTSGVNLSAGEDGFTPMIDTMKNMFSDMSALERFGVIGGYDFANDEGDVVDYMARIRRQQGLTSDNGISAQNAFYKIWDGLGGLTTKSDGATRKGVFDAVYKRMKDTIDERTGEVYTDAAALSEAAYQSLEVINFGRRGLSPMFRVVTSAIPFLNARIQGLDLIYRSFRGTYSAQDKLQEGETLDELKNRIFRRTFLRGGTIVASTMLYYLLVSDTEEYKEAKRELRDDNWLIPTPFDYTLKIPIPFEIGMMFKAIPERFIDLVLGEKVLGVKESVEKDPFESIRRQVGTSANIPFLSGDISIQAIKPLFEAVTNRSAFTNTEIVPYYKLKREPGYQSSPQTNELARLIGEALNISPTKIEYVLNGYTGTLGGYVLDVVDSLTRTATGSPYIPNNIFSNPTNFAQYPLIKRLVVDNKKMGGLQQQFYELRGEVDSAVQTLNSLRKQKRFDELGAYKSDVKGLLNVKGRVRAMERYLANWRNRRDRLMRRTDISVLVKAEMLQELEAERDKRLAFIPELRKKANVPILQGGL
jgi:cation transport regulator ChaC